MNEFLVPLKVTVAALVNDFFVATPSTDGSHYVAVQVSESVTMQQEA